MHSIFGERIDGAVIKTLLGSGWTFPYLVESDYSERENLSHAIDACHSSYNWHEHGF